MATWRVAQVFISSTFCDMHAERDHMIIAVFTELWKPVEQFFACVLSQRYGWVPEPRHFRDTTKRQRHQQELRSITDLVTTHIGPHEGANHVC